MIKKIGQLLIVVAFLGFVPVLLGDMPKKYDLPDGAGKKADSFVQSLFKEDSAKIYEGLDTQLKMKVSREELLKTLDQIKKVIVGSEYRYSHGNYYPESNTVALIYDVKAKDILCELSVALAGKNGGYSVMGFNLRDKPRKLLDFKGASPFHYIIFTVFIISCALMLASLLFFAFRKGLSKKQRTLYVLSAFVGFPVGVGLNWTTGAYILRFGLNVPPMGISAPVEYPGIWTLTVFFPLGAYLMFNELQKWKKSGTA